MNRKMCAAIFVAAGLFATTNIAFAEEDIVRTETVQPSTAETTTTTTTNTDPGATTIERTTTTDQPAVEQKTTYIEKKKHKHLINLHIPFIHASVD